MPSTPYLGITELTPNQTGKETTINTAILALEAAGNATLAVSLAAGDVTLSAAQFTSSFIFALSGALAARTLSIPTLINAVNVQRIFAVRNASGFAVTVRVAASAGTNVIVANGQILLLYADGAGNVGVVSMPPSFVNLADAPASYTGHGLDVVRVKTTEDGLEFAVPHLSDLTGDVDLTTTPPTDGQLLAFHLASGKWIPYTQPVASSKRLIPFFFTTAPIANEILAIYGCSDIFTIPGSLAGTEVVKQASGGNPTADFVIDVRRNNASIGSITIHSDGTVTLAGAGATVAVGDVISVHAPSTTSPSILNWAINIVGNL